MSQIILLALAGELNLGMYFIASTDSSSLLLGKSWLVFFIISALLVSPSLRGWMIDDTLSMYWANNGQSG